MIMVSGCCHADVTDIPACSSKDCKCVDHGTRRETICQECHQRCYTVGRTEEDQRTTNKEPK